MNLLSAPGYNQKEIVLQVIERPLLVFKALLTVLLKVT